MPEECAVAEGDGDCSVKRQKDPTFGLEQQRGFLLLWKQLETVKESWGCHRLGVQQIHSPTLYQHFTTLYRCITALLCVTQCAIAYRMK